MLEAGTRFKKTKKKYIYIDNDKSEKEVSLCVNPGCFKRPCVMRLDTDCSKKYNFFLTL